MESEGIAQNFRDFLALVFISKSISKKLLIINFFVKKRQVVDARKRRASNLFATPG